MKIFDTEWNQQGKNVNAVQVLTPLREDTKVSANALNIKIKDRINPYQRGQQEIKSGNKIFRIQDKVMQTKNEDEISNGDIGIVRKIGKMNGKKTWKWILEKKGLCDTGRRILEPCSCVCNYCP